MKQKQIISKISHIRALSYAYIEAELTARGHKGIVPSHGNILMLLATKKEPIPINIIGTYVGKTKSTLTSNIRTLEKFGYIQKTKNPQDSRSTLVSLTEKGKQFMPVFLDISRQTLAIIYQDMEKEEKQKLFDSLCKIENNLQQKSSHKEQ